MYAAQIQVNKKEPIPYMSGGENEGQKNSLNINGRATTVHAAQIQAYKTAKIPYMSGREIEAGALTRSALMLSECQKNWDDPDRDQNLAEALHTNQRVWTILQSELAKDDNPLPIEIRKNILTLSVFIDKRIIEVMAYPASEKLKILIDINLNLAAGLRGSPAD